MGLATAASFKLAANCFYTLAWPVLALVYPICATVWAIETDSNSDLLELVTYWVLFSLLSLFEFVFVKLLEWLPFWPYLKLWGIYWLVTSQFSGAFYIYKQLIRPCFSINEQFVINWFNKRKEKHFLKKFEDFYIAADKYIAENGHEALKKLLASKLKISDLNSDAKKFKPDAAVLKTDLAQPEETMQGYLCQNENQAAAAGEKCDQGPRKCAVRNKKCQDSAEEEEEIVRAASTKKKCQRRKKSEKASVESEDSDLWCDVCDIWCTSSFDMAYHLSGKIHLAHLIQMNTYVGDSSQTFLCYYGSADDD